MATYYVPNLGPLVYMNPEAEAWAERTGHKVEKKEFADLEAARAFARNVHSRVEDEKGNVVWSMTRPQAGASTGEPGPAARQIP
jgi:hypothetical protein